MYSSEWRQCGPRGVGAVGAVEPGLGRVVGGSVGGGLGTDWRPVRTVYVPQCVEAVGAVGVWGGEALEAFYVQQRVEEAVGAVRVGVWAGRGLGTHWRPVPCAAVSGGRAGWGCGRCGGLWGGGGLGTHWRPVRTFYAQAVGAVRGGGGGGGGGLGTQWRPEWRQ